MRLLLIDTFVFLAHQSWGSQDVYWLIKKFPCLNSLTYNHPVQVVKGESSMKHDKANQSFILVHIWINSSFVKFIGMIILMTTSFTIKTQLIIKPQL